MPCRAGVSFLTPTQVDESSVGVRLWLPGKSMWVEVRLLRPASPVLFTFFPSRTVCRRRADTSLTLRTGDPRPQTFPTSGVPEPSRGRSREGPPNRRKSLSPVLKSFTVQAHPCTSADTPTPGSPRTSSSRREPWFHFDCSHPQFVPSSQKVTWDSSRVHRCSVPVSL